MPFTGWPPAAVEFYDGLEEDNSRDYWQAHKDVYDRAVRAPMDALLTELEPEFGAPKVFRPYRDVRFSHDKSPYKTAIGAVCADGDGRVCYVQLSAAGLMAGGGRYDLDREELARFRAAVADDVLGARLERVVADMEGAGVPLGRASALRSAPRGYARDHPRIDLLRLTRVYGGREWPVRRWLHSRAAAGHVREAWHAVRPLQDWLLTHVG